MPYPTNPTARSHLADAGYAALAEGAALVDLTDRRTVLRLSGKDPVGMLDAVLTNAVPEATNLGAYALLLNPKGRVLADVRVVKAPPGEGVMIDTERAGCAAAKELLGRYAPFSRVKLEDLGAEAEEPWGLLGLYGPRARSLLGGLELGEHESAWIPLGGAEVLAAGVAVPVAGCDLLAPASALAGVREYLVERGAVPADAAVYETARVAAGVPRFGSDVTPDNFPAEAGLLDRAVSFEKGCYPGQETVARMRYRGHANRKLRRLSVEGSGAEPGAPISQNGKRVGEITSLAPLPVRGHILALGYLHRSADPHGELACNEATLRVLG